MTHPLVQLSQHAPSLRQAEMGFPSKYVGAYLLDHLTYTASTRPADKFSDLMLGRRHCLLRHRTFAIPNSRSLQSGFGMPKRRTGFGLYVPSIGRCSMGGRAFVRCSWFCIISRPSTPATPSRALARAILALCLPDQVAGTVFIAGRLKRGATLPYREPPRCCGHLMHYTFHRQVVRHSYSFGPSPAAQDFRPHHRLLGPLLTSRSGLHRGPFSHEARSPKVRMHSFTAQPPDLRYFALTTKARGFWPARLAW